MANIALIVLCLVAAASAVASPIGVGGVGVGVGQSVAVSQHVGVGRVGIGKFLPYGLGYGMMGGMVGKGGLRKKIIGLGIGHRIGFKIAKGAGRGIVKGAKRIGMMKQLSMMGMYPGGIGVGYGLMG